MLTLRLVVLLALALPPASAQVWADLGGGIAGAQGIPGLAGAGDLSPGTPGSLTITGTPPFAPAMLFFSLLQVGVPFKGGTLEAYPPITEFVIVLGPNGLTIPWANWTDQLPAGLDLYIQIAALDQAAVKNASLTNLLRGTTQP